MGVIRLFSKTTSKRYFYLNERDNTVFRSFRPCSMTNYMSFTVPRKLYRLALLFPEIRDPVVPGKSNEPGNCNNS